MLFFDWINMSYVFWLLIGKVRVSFIEKNIWIWQKYFNVMWFLIQGSESDVIFMDIFYFLFTGRLVFAPKEWV